MAFKRQNSSIDRIVRKVATLGDLTMVSGARYSVRNGLCVVALMMGLAACSSVPDAVNPVHWYQWAMSDSPDDEATAESEADAAANKIKAAKTSGVSNGLVGDQANAGYAPSVSRQVADTKPLVKRPVPDAAALASVAPTPTLTPPPAAGAERPLVQQSASAAPTPIIHSGSLLEHYHRRLLESAALTVTTPVAEFGVEGGGQRSGSALHLTPPKSKGVGTATGSSFQVAVLSFSPGSATLSPSDLEALREVVSLYKKSGGVVRVTGLGVPTGLAAPTVILSSGAKAIRATPMSRAEAAGQELVRLGIPAAKVLVGAVAIGTPPSPDGAAAKIYLDM